MRNKSVSAEKLAPPSPGDRAGRVGLMPGSPGENKGVRKGAGSRSPIHWRLQRSSVSSLACVAALVAFAVSAAATICFLQQRLHRQQFVEELRTRRREAGIAFEASRITNTFYWQNDQHAPWRQVVRDWEQARTTPGPSTSGQLAGLLRRFGGPLDKTLDRATTVVHRDTGTCGPDSELCDLTLIEALTPVEFQSPPTAYWGKPEVPTAFVLYAHTFETVHGAERLLYWLYAEEHTFVFHLDQKAPEAAAFYLRQKYGGLKNVGFAPRNNVTWGSWGVVQAEIDGIQVARQMSSEWKFVISLCGATVLIKPASYLDFYLKTKLIRVDSSSTQEEPSGGPGTRIERDSKNYISVIPTQQLSALDARNRFRADHEKRLLNYTSCISDMRTDCQPYSNTPGGHPWWKGAQWKIMARDFAEYALDSSEGKAWIEFFKTGFIQNGCTDEIWAQTIMMNSNFQERNFFSSVNVYDMWPVQSVVACSYIDTRPGIWPGMSPCYLSLWEYDDILETPLIFARKFRFNDPVIERIREDIIFGTLASARESGQFEQWSERAVKIRPPPA